MGRVPGKVNPKSRAGLHLTSRFPDRERAPEESEARMTPFQVVGESSDRLHPPPMRVGKPPPNFLDQIPEKIRQEHGSSRGSPWDILEREQMVPSHPLDLPLRNSRRTWPDGRGLNLGTPPRTITVRKGVTRNLGLRITDLITSRTFARKSPDEGGRGLRYSVTPVRGSSPMRWAGVTGTVNPSTRGLENPGSYQMCDPKDSRPDLGGQNRGFEGSRDDIQRDLCLRQVGIRQENTPGQLED